MGFFPTDFSSPLLLSCVSTDTNVSILFDVLLPQFTAEQKPVVCIVWPMLCCLLNQWKSFLSPNQIIWPIGLTSNMYDFSGLLQWFTLSSSTFIPPSESANPLQFFIAVFHCFNNFIEPITSCVVMSVPSNSCFYANQMKTNKNKNEASKIRNIYTTQSDFSESFWHNLNHSPIKLKLWKFRVLLFRFSRLSQVKAHVLCLYVWSFILNERGSAR